MSEAAATLSLAINTSEAVAAIELLEKSLFKLRENASAPLNVSAASSSSKSLTEASQRITSLEAQLAGMGRESSAAIASLNRQIDDFNKKLTSPERRAAVTDAIRDEKAYRTVVIESLKEQRAERTRAAAHVASYYEDVSKGARATSSSVKSMMESMVARPAAMVGMADHYRDIEKALERSIPVLNRVKQAEEAWQVSSNARIKQAVQGITSQKDGLSDLAAHYRALEAADRSQSIASSVVKLREQESIERSSADARVKASSQALREKQKYESEYTRWFAAELAKREKEEISAVMRAAKQRSQMATASPIRVAASVDRLTAPSGAESLSAHYLSMGAVQGGGNTLAIAEAKALRDLESQMGRVGQAAKGSGDHLTHWNKIAEEAHAGARGLSGALGGLWMTYGSLVPLLAGAAFAGSMKEVFSVGKQLEFQFTAISAISNGATVDIEKFNKAVAGTMFTPIEAAKGLRVLAQAGLSVSEATEALPSVLKLATVGETDMGTAALATTSIMHSFGLSVGDFGHIGDVFAKAAAISATSVTEMMEAMKQASSISDMFGVSVEETAAALATLANRGIEGSAAGTAIRNMVKELSSPATAKAADAMKQYGIEVFNADGSLKTLTENLQQLRTATIGMSDKSRTSFLETLFNERGVKAANILLSDMDKMKSSMEELKNASDGLGFMTEASIKLSLSTEGMMKTLQSDFQRTLGSVFDSVQPSVQVFISSLSDLVNSSKFKEFLEDAAHLTVKLTEALVNNASTISNLAIAYASFKGFSILASGVSVALTALKAMPIALAALEVAGAASAASMAGVGVAATGAVAGVAGVGASTGALAGTMTLLTGPAGLVAAGILAVGYAAYKAYEALYGLNDEQQRSVEAAEQMAASNKTIAAEATRGAEALDQELARVREQIRLMREGASAADAYAQSLATVPQALGLQKAAENTAGIKAKLDAANAKLANLQKPAELVQVGYHMQAGQQGILEQRQKQNEINALKELYESARKNELKAQEAYDSAKIKSVELAADRELIARSDSAKKANKQLADIEAAGAEARAKINDKSLSEAARKTLQHNIDMAEKAKPLLTKPLSEGGEKSEPATKLDVEARNAEIDAIRSNSFKPKSGPSGGGFSAARAAQKDARAILEDKLSSELKREQIELATNLLNIDIQQAAQDINSVQATTRKNEIIGESIGREHALIQAKYEAAKVAGDEVNASKFYNQLLENEDKAKKQVQQSTLDLTKARVADNDAKDDSVISAKRYIEDLNEQRDGLGKTALQVELLRIEREKLRRLEDIDIGVKRGTITPEVAEQYRLDEELKAQARADDAAYQDSFVGGWNSAFDEYAKSASRAANSAQSVFQASTTFMESALEQFITKGKIGWRDLAASALASVAKTMASKAMSDFMGIAANFVSGLFGGGSDLSPIGSSGMGAIPAADYTALTRVDGFAKGGVIESASLHNYVNTVQSSPTYFQMGKVQKFASGGVFGEAGPEAVMPLSRDSQGRLGVKSQGGNGGGDVNISITINESEGGQKTDAKGDANAGWNQFAQRIKGMILDEMTTQKRPGGLLYG